MSFLKTSYIAFKAVEMNWFPFTYILDNLITNSIHAWLTKDYRSLCMIHYIIYFIFYFVYLLPYLIIDYVSRNCGNIWITNHFEFWFKPGHPSGCWTHLPPLKFIYPYQLVVIAELALTYLTTYSLWSAMHELSLLLDYQVYR